MLVQIQLSNGDLPMQLHGFHLRVRTLMATVALLAACIAVGLEYVRLMRAKHNYETMSYMYDQRARRSLQEALNLRSRYEKMKETPNASEEELMRYSLMARSFEADFAANANLAAICKHAASHPWEAFPRNVTDVAELTPEILMSSSVQYYLGPAPPPPPGYISVRKGLKGFSSKRDIE